MGSTAFFERCTAVSPASGGLFSTTYCATSFTSLFADSIFAAQRVHTRQIAAALETPLTLILLNAILNFIKGAVAYDVGNAA
ncbi:MAG: hypothetical protein SPE01_07640 [Candidatus Spyradocola sp.]|nr:hypothetical protein [Candidatus Spyradocola sp.]